MSKMSEELEKRLDENKYELLEACRGLWAEIHELNKTIPKYEIPTALGIRMMAIKDVIAKIEGEK